MGHTEFGEVELTCDQKLFRPNSKVWLARWESSRPAHQAHYDPSTDAPHILCRETTMTVSLVQTACNFHNPQLDSLERGS